MFRIFCDDLKSISGKFFAIVIALALLVFPALYSWFNLYATWDPYANTGRIPIAVASNDIGYRDDNGSIIFKSEEVLENLADNNSFGWVILDSSEEAINGVKSGEYYGALIFEEEFSNNMYDIENAVTVHEHTITFYENAKANAVAQKIIESAANDIKYQIKETYLTVLFESLFEKTNIAGEKIEDADAVKNAVNEINEIRSNLNTYTDILTEVISSENQLDYLVNQGYVYSDDIAKITSGSKETVADAESIVKDTKKYVDSASKETIKRLRDASSHMDELSRLLTEMGKDEKQGTEVMLNLLNTAIEETEIIIDDLTFVRAVLPPGSYDNIAGDMADIADSLLINLKDMQSVLLKFSKNCDYGKNLSEAADSLSSILSVSANLLNGTLIPTFDDLSDDAVTVLELLIPVIDAGSDAFGSANDIIGSVSKTGDSAADSLRALISLNEYAESCLDELAYRISTGDADDILDNVIRVMKGDASEYATFLAEPVKVSTVDIYELGALGHAMLPFYSTLAIWVGGVMLIAIFNVEPQNLLEYGLSERKKYYGKLLLYLFFGMLQATVIYLSDMFILPGYAQRPWLLYLSMIITSIVFNTLIYSLTLAFGDIGKAVVVVIMVLQISGSSGSYPIELLPDIYNSIYLFFPFPYAINAMREAICGLYGSDYVLCLMRLGIFMILGILIGRVIRKPFVGVKKFMEKELEETGLL